MTNGRYLVRCDDCLTTIRRTDSVAESARGGHCDRCNAELDARYPERAANRARAIQASLADPARFGIHSQTA